VNSKVIRQFAGIINVLMNCHGALARGLINLTAIYRYISEILLIFKVWKGMISESYQALSGIVFASVQ
jgi:hypothetical protein